MAAKGPKPLSSREPDEYVEATEQAREVRAAVAEQVKQHIIESDMTGGEGLFAVRLHEYARAKATGDRDVMRSAVMELTAAGGAWLAALDLGQRPTVAPLPAAA